MTGEGRLVEVQATAEGEPFPRATLDSLLDLAAGGVGPDRGGAEGRRSRRPRRCPARRPDRGVRQARLMRFVLATRNAHKLAEYRAILAPHEVAAMPAGIELPPEGVDSFEDNARGKAEGLARALAALRRRRVRPGRERGAPPPRRARRTQPPPRRSRQTRPPSSSPTTPASRSPPWAARRA